MNKLEDIKLLILDFDGTLADTLQVILNTMQSTLHVLGLPERSNEECRSMIGLRLTEIPQRLFPELEGIGDAYAAAYRTQFPKYNVPGAVPLFPMVLESLHELSKRGYLLSIASSRGHESLDNYLKELHLESIISYVVAAEDVTHAKPDAEPVLKTLAHYGLQAHEALVIGDTDFDILMGANAGCHTCGVSYGNGSRASLQEAGAEVIIDSFDKILELLS